ncbi:hypothetical protein K1X76_08695 [bacterium]|nr:hypothetical protein [bacterium]
MREINISHNCARLSAYALNFFLKNKDCYYNLLNSLWSRVFYIESELVRLDFKIKKITEREKQEQYRIIDAKISKWDQHLVAWQHNKYYVKQYLNEILQKLKEAK